MLFSFLEFHIPFLLSSHDGWIELNQHPVRSSSNVLFPVFKYVANFKNTKNLISTNSLDFQLSSYVSHSKNKGTSLFLLLLNLIQLLDPLHKMDIRLFNNA